MTLPGLACTPSAGHDGTVALTASTVGPAPTSTSSGPFDGGPGTGAGPEPMAAAEGTSPRPDWLGRRTLPTTPDGRVVVPQTTPEELLDRRLVTVDTLDPPSGEEFVASVGPVEPDVLARSTWIDGCPVEPGDLRYLTIAFWGFDQRPHTGEMIVHRSVATDIVAVFQQLYERRFPIEEMRVVSPDDLIAPPTGDGNNTTSFVCRPVTGGRSFSEHASGLAVDINPFHNPYHRDDLILPELAVDYLDRSPDRPGLIRDGDATVAAFAAIGWSWGGDWQSLRDYQHFSLNGR